jgi:hypothetical protein
VGHERDKYAVIVVISVMQGPKKQWSLPGSVICL